MKKVLATLLTMFLLATMIPLGAVSVSAADHLGCIIQTETKWKSYVHGTGSLYKSGCGIFSLVNAVGYLTGQRMDVVAVADWAYSIGAYNKNGSEGTYRALLYPKVEKKYGTTYGFTVDCGSSDGYWAGSSSSTLKTHLSNGGVAIGHVPNHFIAIVGYDSSANKFHVYDSAPSSERGTNKNGGDVWVTQSALATGKLKMDWFCLLSSTGKPVGPVDLTNPDDYPMPTRDLLYTSPVKTGDDVRWVQAVLLKLGFSVDIDGSYGPGTRDAIKAFQKKYGLTADGSCGPATRAKLLECWNNLKNFNANLHVWISDKPMGAVPSQFVMGNMVYLNYEMYTDSKTPIDTIVKKNYKVKMEWYGPSGALVGSYEYDNDDNYYGVPCNVAGVYRGKVTVTGDISKSSEVACTVQYSCSVGGHKYTGQVTAAATCNKAGVKTYTCSECGHKYTETIPATGNHSYTAATCTKPKTCSVCGTTSGSALGHKYDNNCDTTCNVCGASRPVNGHSYSSKVTTSATCEKDGVKTHTCSECGHKYTETIPALKHDRECINGYEPTCTEDGMTDYEWCNICGKVFMEQEVIPAKGHTVVVGKGYDATCTKPGLTECHACSTCGEILKAEEVIPAKGHEYDDDYDAFCNVCGFERDALCRHSYESQVTTAATCDKSGVKTYTCSHCGDKYTEEIPATGEHDYRIEGGIPNSCMTDGFAICVCSVCGDTYSFVTPALGRHTVEVIKGYDATCTESGLTDGEWCSWCEETLVKQEIISAKGHEYDDDYDAFCNVCGFERDALCRHNYESQVTTAATCDKNGVKTYTCSECGDTYTETILATGHTMIMIPGYAATCTASGLTDGEKCSMCGEVFVVQETIPAMGHNYESIWLDAPTCGASGAEFYSCSHCKDAYAEELPATGKHSYSSKVTTAATCANAGEKTYTCSGCGHNYVETIPALDHNVVIVSGYAATCTASGLTDGEKCSVCGEILVVQETIPALGHISVVVKGYEPTCSMDGKTDGEKCSACDEILVAQETLPAPGHVSVVVKGYDSTCDASGLTDGEKCSVCGMVIVAQRPIMPHGHIAVSVKGYDASCIATGLTDGKNCSVCGLVIIAQETIPALGHVYSSDFDETCNTCGEIRDVVLPADAPAFVVEDASACAGQEFTVAIRTERNSGIVSFKLKLDYDADLLELVSVVEKDFTNMSFSPLTNNPFIINWVDALRPNNTTNGVVALVTFRVKEGAAAGKTEINLSYVAEDVYDQNFDNVAFLVENGAVEIVDYTPGDVNDDGAVNNKDLGLLQRLLNEWDVTANEKAADANGDGAINNKDLGILQRYLNEWDVELG